jgi:hypothetical protein
MTLQNLYDKIDDSILIKSKRPSIFLLNYIQNQLTSPTITEGDCKD